MFFHFFFNYFYVMSLVCLLYVSNLIFTIIFEIEIKILIFKCILCEIFQCFMNFFQYFKNKFKINV